jgi:hypothetical protein
MSEHFLYTATATKFKHMHEAGIVDTQLESSYFGKCKPGDVIWVIEVQRENDDAAILGRLAIQTTARVGRKTRITALASRSPSLACISLEKHNIYLQCVDTPGGTGGMCSSRWGTPYTSSGATAKYARWVRTGWQLTEDTAQKLEAVWDAQSG